jgi:hypothetical protein
MGTRPFTLVIEEPGRKWYDIMYNDHYLAPSAVLYINGRMINITGFKGKLVEARNNTVERFSLEDARKFRYSALSIRQTLCNHINLANKYKYDIRDYDCNYCYCALWCNLNFQRSTSETKVALVVQDLYKLSEYFRMNGDTDE